MHACDHTALHSIKQWWCVINALCTTDSCLLFNYNFLKSLSASDNHTTHYKHLRGQPGTQCMYTDIFNYYVYIHQQKNWDIHQSDAISRKAFIFPLKCSLATTKKFMWTCCPHHETHTHSVWKMVHYHEGSYQQQSSKVLESDQHPWSSQTTQ